MKQDFHSEETKMRYLNGQLSKAEQNAFEAAAQKDQSLREAIDFEQDLSLILQNRVLLQKVEQSLGDAFFDDDTGKQTGQRVTIKTPALNWYKRIIPVAAGLLILTIIGAVLFANLTYANTRLAATTAEELKITTATLLSLGDATTDASAVIWQQALQLLQQEKYAAAAPLFEQVPATSTNYPQALLYAAFAHLQLKNYSQVKNLASKALATQLVPATRMQMEWLQAKSLLGIGGQLPEVRRLLATMSKDATHVFSAQAEALMAELDSPWRNLLMNP